jgi:hypothetical protein
MNDQQKMLLAAALKQAERPPPLDVDLGDTPLHVACRGHMNYEQAWLNQRLQKFHTRQPGILYGFCESEIIEAFAIEPPGIPPAFIVLSPYSLYALGSFFYNALALPFILVDVGESSLELEQVELRSQNLTLIRPFGKDRRDIARMLLMWAVRFFTAHELTHIVHGHIRLLQSQFNSCSMAEALHFSSREEATVLQTLEMDADCGAMKECLEGLLLSENDIADPRNANLHYVYKNPELALKLWSFAIYSLFRIFADGVSVPYQTASHPPPMSRVLMVQNAALEFMMKNKLDHLKKPLIDSCSSAIVDVESICLDGQQKCRPDCCSRSTRIVFLSQCTSSRMEASSTTS